MPRQTSVGAVNAMPDYVVYRSLLALIEAIARMVGLVVDARGICGYGENVFQA